MVIAQQVCPAAQRAKQPEPKFILQESRTGETGWSQPLCAEVGVSGQGTWARCCQLCHPVHPFRMSYNHQNEKYAGVAVDSGADIIDKLTMQGRCTYVLFIP